MNQKLKVSLIFLLSIMLVSSYFLWQIDRHEKALLGHGWINTVPYLEWQQYLKQKSEFDKKLKKHIDENPNIMEIIANLKNRKSQKLEEIFDDLPPAPGKFNPFDETFSNESHIPSSLYLPKGKQKIFSQEYPNEFKIWSSIITDLNRSEYKTPTPSNPPKAVIYQDIKTYYRYMALIDGVLALGLIVTLITYKEKNTAK